MTPEAALAIIERLATAVGLAWAEPGRSGESDAVVTIS